MERDGFMTYSLENLALLESFIKPIARRLMKMDGKSGLWLVVYQGNKALRFEDLEPIYQLVIGKAGKYEKIAKAKAIPAWRTGYSSGDAADCDGFFTDSGDAIWKGSSVITAGDNRIVASVSGLTGIHDEYLSMATLDTLRMVGKDVIDQLSKADGIMP